MLKTVSLVIPCFNEAKNIAPLISKIEWLVCNLKEYRTEVFFVNDGSTDDTLSLLSIACAGRDWMSVVTLTRNFGKEAALTAGLDIASGNAVVFMDADLQHPVEVILEFVNRWQAGALVVVGKRMSRDQDSPLYKRLATAFYYIHNNISDIKIPTDVGDFRLIDRQVAEQLRSLRESRRFMKGLFAWVGYDYELVEYTVEKRLYGISSFNKWRAWNLALEGITSFSTIPLRLWTYVGLIVFILGSIYALWILVSSLIFGVITPGYFTLLAAIVVFGGVQLIGIGVLGEYLGRIYVEVKHRPPYLIEKIISGRESKRNSN
jgi:polyisoprenyl-phosphate glycosyltransferase